MEYEIKDAVMDEYALEEAVASLDGESVKLKRKELTDGKANYTFESLYMGESKGGAMVLHQDVAHQLDPEEAAENVVDSWLEEEDEGYDLGLESLPV